MRPLKYDTPCPSCGYNLRGLDGSVCPECGARFDPRSFYGPTREIPLAELLNWPFVDIVLLVANGIIFFLAWLFPPGFGPIGKVAYGVFLLAFFVSWSAWRALKHDTDDAIDALRARLTLENFLFKILGLNLSRHPSALVWAPLTTLALTLAHATLLTVAWLI